MEPNNLKLLSIDQACEYLGLGRWSVYNLINQNRLKSIRIGKRRLVSMNAIQAFISRLEKEGCEA
jgi:excisionase family DNA binding protein